MFGFYTDKTAPDKPVDPIEAERQRAELESREYVSATAAFMTDGRIRPVSITFEDGPTYPISRLINVTHMSATRQGGNDTRYRIKIGAREHNLFFEDRAARDPPRWYVKKEQY